MGTAVSTSNRKKVVNMMNKSLAYRTVGSIINTGNEKLIFNACWPADAGYDYDTIYNEGFSCRIFNQNGTPLIIETDKK